jgi:NAD(P)-dependent dehydrogenase (short-subunit alcohol dehydrogenase family)
MSTHFDLDGKTILVTGASSGIGKSCVERIVRSGARVIAIGRSAEKLAALAGVAGDDQHVLDLLDEAALKGFVKALKRVGIQLSGCVLAAGTHSFRPFILEGFAEIAMPWLINVQSCLALIASLAKSRILARGASIVLFSSAAARTGSPAAASYAASKGAIEAATYTLALELGVSGVRVNAVAPGVVKTAMSESFLAKLSSEQFARLEAHHPMGLGTPEDVSGPATFLLTDDARWINGAILPIDGGYSIS